MLSVCKCSCRALWLKSLMSFLTSRFLQHPAYFSASLQVFFFALSEVFIHSAKQQKFTADESFTNDLCLSVGAATDFSTKLAQKIGGSREPVGAAAASILGRNANTEVKMKGINRLKTRLQH